MLTYSYLIEVPRKVYRSWQKDDFVHTPYHVWSLQPYVTWQVDIVTIELTEEDLVVFKLKYAGTVVFGEIDYEIETATENLMARIERMYGVRMDSLYWNDSLKQQIRHTQSYIRSDRLRRLNKLMYSEDAYAE